MEEGRYNCKSDFCENATVQFHILRLNVHNQTVNGSVILHLNSILMHINKNVAGRDLQILMDSAYSLAKRLDETELIFPLHTPMSRHNKLDFDSDDDSSWSEIEVIELESTTFDTLSENDLIGNESRINFTEEFGAMSVKMPV